MNYILAFILGFSCFIVQLVLLRLFLNIFTGNELVIGIALGLWMLLTAFGAWIGHRSHGFLRNKFGIFGLIIGLGMFPLAGILLAVTIRNMLFLPGVMVNLSGVLIVCIAGMALFCLASGMLFTMLASMCTDEAEKNQISRIYAIEAAGSLLGGLIFYFILIPRLNSIEILNIVLSLNILSAALFLFVEKKRLLAGISFISGVAIVIMIFFTEIQSWVNRQNYPGREILAYADTPYGELAVTARSGLIDLYLSGGLMGTSDDVISREEKVHYPMSLHPDPVALLMLFGGLDGALDEAIKYSICSIDYVDPHPRAIDAAKEYLDLKFPEGLNVYYQDPLGFIRNTDQKYDVIISSAPYPSTIGSNRYYTATFFQLCCKQLNESGILSLKLPPPGNYIDETTTKMYASIYNSLKAIFTHIRIVVGEECFFIASYHPLEGKITESISISGIYTEYVNAFYIDDQLLDDRAMIIRESIRNESGENTIMKPIAAYHLVMQWLNMFNIPFWIILSIPLLLLLTFLLRLSAYDLGMFSTGFTAAAAELLALIVFQSLFGMVYQLAGLIIMIFMAGLVLGAGVSPALKRVKKRSFLINQIALGLFTLCLPFLLILHVHFDNQLIPGILTGIFTFIIAAMTGLQFSLASRLRKGTGSRIASSLYGADLAGSAFGLFLVSIFIFPLLGMWITVIILMVANIAVAIKISTAP